MSSTKTLVKTTANRKASANKLGAAGKLSLDKKEKTEDKDIGLLENKKDSDTPVKNAAGLWSNTLQTSLKIGTPGGKHEKEADAVADRVMNNTGPNQAPNVSTHTISKKEKFQPKPIQKKEEEELQPKFIQKKEEDEAQTKLIQRKEEEIKPQLIQSKEEEEPAQAKQVQRQAEEKEEPVQAKFIQKKEESEEQQVQRKENAEPSNASTSIESSINSTKGQGQPLDQQTQDHMGSSIGADFSNVRVHTDSTSVQMNKDLNSKAFTHGSDIYFNQGNYDTKSNAGKGLLAHELTHTVQQGAAPIQTKAESISKVTKPVVQKKGFIQKKIEQALNWAAERLVPGYTLLNVILGKNIITDAPVARSGVNLIEGFMDLTPVIGKILFNELKETNSLAEAGVWVEKQIAKFGIDFNSIARRLKLMWDEMSIWNGIEGNVKIFKKYFGRDVRKIFSFASVVEEKVKELRFEGALRFVGAHQLLTKLKKNKAAFKKTINNPKIILKFFMTALKQGFGNFKANFGKHFKNALFGWLFGKAAEMGVEIPKKFDVPSLFKFIAQLLGVTYQQIKARVVKRLGPSGEKIVGFMETSAGFVKDLVTKGPIAMWERVKESLADLKNMIFSQITTLVLTEVIKQAVLKLVSMLNPAGAIVQLVLGIYRVITFFIEWWDTIKELANAILSSIINVALGDTKGAAAFIERIMAKGMTLVIAFLANIFGLGGIVKKVKKLIKKISVPIHKAIDKVIKWIVKKARKLLKKGKAKVKGAVKGLVQWWKAKKKYKNKAGESHTILFRGSGKSAKLMIRSDEQPYTTYIKSLKAEHGLTDADIKLAIDKSNQIGAEKKKTVPKAKEKEQGATINKLILELADLMAALPLKPSVTNTTPVYGPLYQGFGTLARVTHLESPHPVGSEPRVPNTQEYNDLNLRRKGGGSYYVKGHLLNENLGGPGTKWSNLTPLSQKANSDHKTKFENPVKLAVNNSTGEYKKTTKKWGFMNNFIVKAIYGRKEKTNTIKKLTETTDPLPGLDKATDRNKLARVLKAEVWVPTSLECNASVQKKGETAPKNVPANIPVKIDYGDLSEYSIAGGPVKVANPVNLSTASVSKMTEVKGISSTIAFKIYQYRKKLAETGVTQFHSFKALADNVEGLELSTLTELSQKGLIKLK